MVYIPALLRTCMQLSWFRELLTLYTRNVLTPSCCRVGKSRAHVVALANGSVKVDGDRNVLSALATTSPKHERISLSHGF